MAVGDRVVGLEKGDFVVGLAVGVWVVGLTVGDLVVGLKVSGRVVGLLVGDQVVGVATPHPPTFSLRALPSTHFLYIVDRCQIEKRNLCSRNGPTHQDKF